MMKKLLPLFGILVVALIAISTGAFTSVTATRNATIMVAGDASALLALAPCTGPNGAYVDYDNDGALFLDFANLSNTKLKGVNVDAYTYVYDVFSITNNGTQQVYVTLSKEGTNSDRMAFSINETYGVLLDIGERYDVAFKMDTHGLTDGDNILSSITLTAKAVGTASYTDARNVEDIF